MMLVDGDLMVAMMMVNVLCIFSHVGCQVSRRQHGAANARDAQTTKHCVRGDSSVQHASHQIQVKRESSQTFRV
jgi:hypothetical protein